LPMPRNPTPLLGTQRVRMGLTAFLALCTTVQWPVQATARWVERHERVCSPQQVCKQVPKTEQMCTTAQSCQNIQIPRQHCQSLNDCRIVTTYVQQCYPRQICNFRGYCFTTQSCRSIPESHQVCTPRQSCQTVMESTRQCTPQRECQPRQVNVQHCAQENVCQQVTKREWVDDPSGVQAGPAAPAPHVAPPTQQPPSAASNSASPPVGSHGTPPVALGRPPPPQNPGAGAPSFTGHPRPGEGQQAIGSRLSPVMAPLGKRSPPMGQSTAVGQQGPLPGHEGPLRGSTPGGSFAAGRLSPSGVGAGSRFVAREGADRGPPQPAPGEQGPYSSTRHCILDGKTWTYSCSDHTPSSGPADGNRIASPNAVTAPTGAALPERSSGCIWAFQPGCPAYQPPPPQARSQALVSLLPHYSSVGRSASPSPLETRATTLWFQEQWDAAWKQLGNSVTSGFQQLLNWRDEQWCLVKGGDWLQCQGDAQPQPQPQPQPYQQPLSPPQYPSPDDDVPMLETNPILPRSDHPIDDPIPPED
jgi:hypothetical protein